MREISNVNSKTIDIFRERTKVNSVEMENSSYYTFFDGHVFEDSNLFRDKYFNLLLNNSEIKILNDYEYAKYYKRPKLLSADLYNTTSYWYILLILNRMKSVNEFKKHKIRVLTNEGHEIIKKILIKEESDIELNKNTINTILNNE